MAASEALRNQVSTKWQDSFNRLNRGAGGISGLMEFSKAWAVAAEFLRPRDLGAPPKDFNAHEVRSAFDVLMQCRMLSMLLESFVEEMCSNQHLITDDVMKYVATSGDRPTHAATGGLVLCMGSRWRSGHTISSAYIVTFQTHVFSVPPATFAAGFKRLLAATLTLSTEGVTPDIPASVQDSRLWPSFELLGLADRYESLIASVCYEYIEKHVVETEWMAEKVAVDVVAVRSGRKDGRGSQDDVAGSRISIRLSWLTKEMFDIIIDYPDSTHALHDLKECLQHIDQRTQLVRALRKA
ncbi:hypothetical protein V8E53_006941, partial [Lactarius tabidus]